MDEISARATSITRDVAASPLNSELAALCRARRPLRRTGRLLRPPGEPQQLAVAERGIAEEFEVVEVAVAVGDGVVHV
jgi:hypothetical protein